jgi:hypothetical protein
MLSGRGSRIMAIDSLADGIRNAIVLKKDEKAMEGWRANLCYTSGREALGNAFAGNNNTPPVIKGIIIATNKRILFLEESGAFSKKYGIRESIGLEKIAGLSAQGGLKNLLSVNVDAQGSSKTLFFAWIAEMDPSTLKKGQKADVQDMRDLLEGLVQTRTEEIEVEQKRDRVQYVLDFSFLKAEMEKGGIVVQTVICPNCSANVSLPSTGTSMKCEYCGSAIHAHDVFEKMKALIGGI